MLISFTKITLWPIFAAPFLRLLGSDEIEGFGKMPKRVKIILVLCLSALLKVGFCSASSFTWTGAVSTDWFNQNNWTPVGVPGSNDTVNVSSGNIDLKEPLIFVGQFNWSGGTLSGNALVIETNAVLNITGNVSLEGALTNYGTVDWEGGAPTVLNNGQSWTADIWNEASAAWNIQCDQTMSIVGNPTFFNEGSVTKTNTTGTTTIDTAFNNTGTVVAQSGTISFANGGVLAGSFQAATNAAITFTAGSFTINSPVFQGPGQIVDTGGSLTLSGAITGPLSFSNGNLSGILAGTLDWSGGQIVGGSTLTVASNAVLNITGSVNLEGTLTNYGTVNWQAGAPTVLNNGQSWTADIWNEAGATWNIQCDQTMSIVGSPTFFNAGSVTKTNTTGTTIIGTIFNNTGTVSAQSGTISFANAGILGGIFQAATNTDITFTAGSITINSPIFQGPGQVAITGGTVTVNSTSAGPFNLSGVNVSINKSFTGVLNYSGGNLFGTSVLSGTLNWNGGQIIGGSSLTVASNGVLNIMANVTLQGALTNYGTVSWQAGAVGVYNNEQTLTANVLNEAGATWNIECDQTMSAFGNPTFFNAGSIIKTAAGNTTSLYIYFYNLGRVVAQSGTISFGEGGFLIGSFQAATNANIAFASGSFVADGTVSLQGPGDITYISGDITSVSSFIVLTNANSTVQIDPATQDGMFSWIVDGTNQLYQRWFWLGAGTNSSQLSLGELGILNGVSSSSSNATMSYLTQQGIIATVEFTLTGGSTGSGASDIAESVAIENTTTNQIPLHLFSYSDFDLAGIADGDSVSSATTNQIVQQGKGMMATETVQSPMPNEWDSSWYAITLDNLDNGSPITLSDSMITPDPGDQTFAFQWDTTLAAGQTFVATSTSSIRPISPAPLNIGLAIALTQSNAFISWPTNGTASYQLQATTNLDVPGAWITITNLPAIMGEQYQVTMPCTNATMFYRLKL
jgi:hypothetical protein